MVGGEGSVQEAMLRQEPCGEPEDDIARLHLGAKALGQLRQGSLDRLETNFQGNAGDRNARRALREVGDDRPLQRPERPALEDRRPDRPRGRAADVVLGDAAVGARGGDRGQVNA